MSRSDQSAAGDGRAAGQRDIVSTIDAARLGAPCVKVLISRGDDGASSLATVLALARALAQRGRAILVAVDSHGLEALCAEGDARVGLAELLTGEAEFGEAIHRDAVSRLHLISVGASKSEPRYDVSILVEALAQTYDFVVFCTRASDLALQLAPLFDKVLLRAEDPQTPLLAERLAASCDDISIVEDARDDLAAA